MYGALLLFEDEFIHIVAISFSSLILTELIMVALNIRTWHYLMVLAELLSLALYILSLIVLHDYFGEYSTNFAICLIINLQNCLCRFRIYSHIRLFVESARHNTGVMLTPLHSKVFA